MWCFIFVKMLIGNNQGVKILLVQLQLKNNFMNSIVECHILFHIKQENHIEMVHFEIMVLML